MEVDHVLVAAARRYSRPGTLIDSKQWFSGKRHSFPPVLTNAVIDWASAFCGCSSSFSAILVANIQQYSGEVKTRITEQYYNGPPPDDIDIIQFFPQSHTFSGMLGPHSVVATTVVVEPNQAHRNFMFHFVYMTTYLCLSEPM